MKTKCLLALFALALTTGCVDTYAVKAKPTPLAPVPAEQKLPLSAALVLDKDLKDYGIMANLVGGKAKFPIGGQLAAYAEDVSRNIFRQVTVFDSPAAAAGKANVVLIPKAVRSSTHMGNPINVLVVVEWQVNDRAGQQTLWLTSIESQTSEKPAAFAYKKHERKAYQKVFDELGQKTLKAFQESPEIKRLAGP